MRLGLLLTEEDSEKLIALADYSECDTYDLISNAIDTMYHVYEVECEEDEVTV